MSTNCLMLPAAAATATTRNLFAAVDMGTNSFKLLIVRADPATGRFLTLDTFKEPVLLGLDACAAISPPSQVRAITALRKFQQILLSHRVPSSHSRLVATSAVREASNQSEFVNSINETLGLEVEVLSGLEEACLIYLGILQFHPVYDRTVLSVDIGGGSTEFAVGKEGKILHAVSLKLGHITLSKSHKTIAEMRGHIRRVIQDSGLTEKIKEYPIEVVIGSSGTIKAIEKAVFCGYALKMGETFRVFEEQTRDWKFCREELKMLVERLIEEEDELEGKVRREGFFKRRADFIVAGAVLLEEIFQMLGIEEMDVSEYALGEGVVTERLKQVFHEYSLHANARWRSTVRLASRFNTTKRMKAGATCAGIAKVIYEGIRQWTESCDRQDAMAVNLDDKDLEYLEAACLLHNIGLSIGKKGYHKQGSRIIKNCNSLHGYSADEVKLIAFLVRHHRKKMPKYNNASLEGYTEEVKMKVKVLCSILRISAAIVKCQSVNADNLEFSRSHESFKLVFGDGRQQSISSGTVWPSADCPDAELEKELENFKRVFQKELSIIVPSCFERLDNTDA